MFSRVGGSIYKMTHGGESRRTALLHASATGDIRTVRLLLNRWKTDVQSKNRQGALETPLILACANGRLAVVQQLLKKGANKTSADQNGWTPLSIAFSKMHWNVVDALLCGSGRSDKRFLETHLRSYLARSEPFVLDHINFVAVAEKLYCLVDFLDTYNLLDANSIAKFCIDESTSPPRLYLSQTPGNPGHPKNRYTPLDMAVRNGDGNVVKILLAKYGEKAPTVQTATNALKIATTGQMKKVLHAYIDHLESPRGHRRRQSMISTVTVPHELESIPSSKFSQEQDAVLHAPSRRRTVSTISMQGNEEDPQQQYVSGSSRGRRRSSSVGTLTTISLQPPTGTQGKTPSQKRRVSFRTGGQTMSRPF